MKQRTMLLTLLLLLALQLGAKHSDQFLIGTYSYILSPAPFFLQQRDTLVRYMNEMGYNSNIIETNQNDKDLAGFLDLLDRNGIDAWIIDRAYSEDPESSFHYSASCLSASSHLRFEAEYKDESDVRPGDGKDSVFWYASRMQHGTNRTGQTMKAEDASNGFVWQTKRGTHKAGYAMADLSYRWPNINGYFVRTGHEFQFFDKNPDHFEGENIWITYRFRISDVAPDTKPEDPLISFRVAGYPLVPTGFAAKSEQLKVNSAKGFASEVSFSYQDFLESQSGKDYLEYTLSLPYQELMDAGLLQRLTRTVIALTNLNPRLYWHGNCTLDLDYVEMRDQISYDMHNMDASFRQRIVDRAQDLHDQGKGNVSGIYVFDEPHQGQFDSHRVLQDILSKADIDILAACYDYRKHNVIIDPEAGIGYDHLDSFLRQVQPKIYSPDIYPVLPQFGFNPGSKDKEFIQDVIDDKLLSVYDKGVRYKLQDPKRKFYPVIQVFGNWVKDEPDRWIAWMLPPYAMQKSLLYLPLVYGVDGVIHYRLQSYQDEEGYGEYVGLITYPSGNKYVDIFESPIPMDAIMHSNPKVKTYGEIIQSLHWQDAHSVMTTPVDKANIPASTFIKTMYVKEQADAPYSGFVQIGHYLDDQYTPWLMAVNRRANYFMAGVYDQEANVPPKHYDEFFPQADPQVLHIEFKPAASKRFGKYIGLLNPHNNEIIVCDSRRRAQIEFPAGEAGLYKVVQTLPAKLNRNLKLKGETLISGNVTLEKGANLKLDKKGTLILAPGSRLLVTPEAKISLAGKIELQKDAQMYIQGYLKDKKADIDMEADSQFINRSKARRSWFKRLFNIK